MKLKLNLTHLGMSALILLAALPLCSNAQTAPANSVIGFPGAGVLQGGDLWESLLPQAFGPYYTEAGTAPTLGVRQFIRFGNFERAWTTPNSHWPNAFPWTMYWSHYMHVVEFNPDTTFNPRTIGGVANPSVYAESVDPGRTYSNYALAAYSSRLNGATDPTRRYSIEPYWIGGPSGPRQQVVYEAGWPTSLGLDVKVRARSFQGPNWNNLNDFVVLEISFKNTGFLDMNMDGVAEKTNNIIRALALNQAGELFMSVSSYLGGGRNVSSISTSFTRMGGYIGDNDPDGNPWAFNANYPGASTPIPTAGNVDIGFNAPTLKMYTDVWNGWVWLDVKQGGLPTDRSKSTGSQPTKLNIFGTHPIGVGSERGWYLSSASGGGLAGAGNYGRPRQTHTVSVGTFYSEGGKTQTIANLTRSPNSNFFASGTTGDITSFVPKPIGSRLRPNGDRKLFSEEPGAAAFVQKPFEDGKADGTTNYPIGWGTWTKGFNFNQDFNGDLYSGLGPVSLGVGEEVTVVIAMVGGYRLEGIQRAVRAARWAYANDYTVPVLPPLPDMRVSNTLTKTVRIEWDNRAESDPGFAGYKIWKSSNHIKEKWLEKGLRLADRYQEQMVVGESKDRFKKPVNPKFDAFGVVNTSALKGEYQPDTWGTWELEKVIPKAALPVTGPSPYKYSYEDKDVVLGFSYWYYVSAYKEGNFTGPGGETTTRIETHYTNRNGANGLWQFTHPFAMNNANFPKTAEGLKNIGAVQTVFSALAPVGDVSGVGVRPNPYKRGALHDNFANVYDHKLLFYNLPPQAKITILDVSGQLINVINFSSSDPNKGSIFWDMFTKDGIEVASGVYIYIVESPSGQKVGHFSILR